MVLSLLAWLTLGPSLARLVQPLGLPYLTANVPFVAMAVGFLLSRQLFLKLPLTTIVTDHHTFQTARFVKSFLIYFGSAILFLLLDLLLKAEHYQVFEASFPKRLLLLPLVLLLTPLQTSVEEVAFRILPVQTINKNQLQQPLGRQLFTSLVSALLFAAPHLGNREVAHAENRITVILYYVLFGFVVTYLCLKTRGFEIALAVHAANNLFIALVCNYPASSLPSLPLLQTSRPIGTAYDILQLLTSLTLVAFIAKKQES